jgi:hypothetical protein
MYNYTETFFTEEGNAKKFFKGILLKYYFYKNLGLKPNSKDYTINLNHYTEIDSLECAFIEQYELYVNSKL